MDKNQTKFILDEKIWLTAWYNIQAIYQNPAAAPSTTGNKEPTQLPPPCL